MYLLWVGLLVVLWKGGSPLAGRLPPPHWWLLLFVVQAVPFPGKVVGLNTIGKQRHFSGLTRRDTDQNAVPCCATHRGLALAATPSNLRR